MSAISQVLQLRRVAIPERARLLGATLRPDRLALVAILLVAAFLNFLQLDREGYSNLYYAATVRSMLTSWHNFFFASYDPGGFVTVDKPPLGFWVQAATAALLGFSGVSLLLPQALAGVASVAVLYQLVRRTFGVAAGLVAALALALMPVTVATNRNNTPDALLVLLLLLAAWAVMIATERGKLRGLLLGAVLVGLGFNVKMLQAYLAVPGLWLLYLIAAPLRRRVRVAHVTVATVVLLAVSFSWAVAVDLTPADRRPYVGSSRTNSVLELIVGYNGLGRLFGAGAFGGPQFAGQPVAPAAADARGTTGAGCAAPQPVQGDAGQPSQGGPAQTQAAVVCLNGENGEPGPLRLFNQQLAGQVSWLIPLGLIGAAAAAWPWRRRWTDRRCQSLVLWGAWLLTGAGFFSVAGFWHRYYLVVIAPPVAALAGIGLLALWRDYRRGRGRGWLLPGALAVTALAQIAFLAPYPDWSGWLSPLILALAVVSIAALIVARLVRGRRLAPSGGPASRALRRLPAAAVTLGLASLLLAPATWAAIPVVNAPGDMLPAGGPSVLGAQALRPPTGTNGGSAGHSGGASGSADAGSGAAFQPPARARVNGGVDQELLRYLLANQGSYRFLVATRDSGTASPIIIATGRPVMALGGFGGGDRILDAQGVARAVSEGKVRYFLLDSDRLVAPGGRAQVLEERGDDVVRWVRDHCRRVPEGEWRSGDRGSGSSRDGGAAGGVSEPLRPGSELWDCASARSG